MEQKWVLMVTAKTPTNMSVIKYWGKRDEKLILAMNESISVTFDPTHLCTTTTVAVSPVFDRDRMWLNGKEMSLSGRRYQNCLREIRARASDVEDETKGIKIAKNDWEKLHVHISSNNNFPTAAGLASSASGFACLVFALAKLMNVQEDNGKLSAIARQVLEALAEAYMEDLLSGSWEKCVRFSHELSPNVYQNAPQLSVVLFFYLKYHHRSGRKSEQLIVEVCFDKHLVIVQEEDGSDSIAVQLVDEKYWDDLVIIIAVVSSQQKETSSSSGMLQTVETSTLMEYRAKEVVPKRVIEMEEAIKNRDFPTFARLTCAENNQFHAICLDTSPPIFYMNDTSHRIISCVEKWNRSVGTPQAAYTCDAGPNVVLMARDREAATLLLRRLLFHFPPNSTDIDSYVVGDKLILKDAGVQNINDVESLPPPPKIEDDVLNYKYKGEIRYFICTRPGKGAILLTDESQALLDPETGLPK